MIKITLHVAPDKLSQDRAIEIATMFRSNHPDNHRTINAYRHGVVFSYDVPKAVFYAWGNPDHVRVRQNP